MTCPKIRCSSATSRSRRTDLLRIGRISVDQCVTSRLHAAPRLYNSRSSDTRVCGQPSHLEHRGEAADDRLHQEIGGQDGRAESCLVPATQRAVVGVGAGEVRGARRVGGKGGDVTRIECECRPWLVQARSRARCRGCRAWSLGLYRPPDSRFWQAPASGRDCQYAAAPWSCRLPWRQPGRLLPPGVGGSNRP